MTIDPETKRKQSFDIFIRIVAAAPDSLIKSLTGKEYAKHAIDGVQVIEDYLFPAASPKEKK